MTGLTLFWALAAAPTPQIGPPPDPDARPAEGVEAVGSTGVAPLPPPPPPVPPSAISRGSWRGVGWMSARLHVSGPIGGDLPARPSVIALGGGAEGGWRVRQWFALGTAFSRQPHEVYDLVRPADGVTVQQRGYTSAWDIALLRFYAPIKGRFDPFLDVSGGIVFYDPARPTKVLAGATIRGSVGFEVWITRSLTLGLSGIYRVHIVDHTVGHVWQSAIDLGVHF